MVVGSGSSLTFRNKCAKLKVAEMVEIKVDGKTSCINGRIEQMIRSLLSKKEIITQNDKVHIGFDCAGPALSVEIKVREVVP